ncbi:probable transcription factor TGAL7 [Coccomyxa sp. Obi]|nr:probable transcription factor TGAL7 [Coccomyxa sp. Obi]
MATKEEGGRLPPTAEEVAPEVEEAAPSTGTGGFRPYKGNTNTNAAISSEMKASTEGAFPEANMAAPVTEQRAASPAATPQPAMSPPLPVSAGAVATPTSAAAIAARVGQPAGPGQRIEVPSGQQLAGQRLESVGQRQESVGQRHSFPGGQRLESLAGNLGSVMASSNNTLDSMRALGSISSGGVVPAAMQLAQRGAMAGYTHPLLQQQYLSSIPWLLRMQGAQQAMFPGGQQVDGAAHAAAQLPLSMPPEGEAMFNTNSVSSKSPEQQAGFPPLSKKRKSSSGRTMLGMALNGEASQKYSLSQSDEDDDNTRADEDEGDMDDKVKRRLAQNREAARKSRQRRKAYVQNLEEEVRQLRQSKSLPAQALAAQSSSLGATGSLGGAATALGLGPDATSLFSAMMQRLPPGSLPDSSGLMGSLRSSNRPSFLASGAGAGDALAQQNHEVLQAFDKWRAEHVATVLGVRQAVNEGANDATLRPLIEEARSQLWTLFAMKKAVVCSESVLLIMNLEHLLPPERLYAWLGGLRASNACNGLLTKLADMGLGTQQRMKLEALRESLLQQENSLGRGYSEVLTELGARAAQQPVLLPGQHADKRVWNSPDILGKLDAMRMTLLRGDNVWEQFLEQTEGFLSLRQYAVAVTALMETSLQLQNLHLPWLQLLRRPTSGE